MFGRCALRLRQRIPFARKRRVLSRRGAAGSGSLVARHRRVHAPCEAETESGNKHHGAKQADRRGVLGYKVARRKRLAHRAPRWPENQVARGYLQYLVEPIFSKKLFEGDGLSTSIILKGPLQERRQTELRGRSPEVFQTDCRYN